MKKFRTICLTMVFCLLVFFFGIRATKYPDFVYDGLISLHQLLIKKVVLQSLFFSISGPFNAVSIL